MCLIVEEPLMFCINFEDDDLVTNDVYQPWVLNDGVTIVEGASFGCPEGKRCGFFNESILELPFFSNNYGHWNSLRITLHYKMIATSDVDQGIVSNDCYKDVANAPGNSLYCSVGGAGDVFKAGLKSSNSSVDANGSAVRKNSEQFSVLISNL